MKSILLAKRLQRILAAFIDMLILTIISGVIFYVGVYPNIFDFEKYENNQQAVIELYKESQLYVVSDEGSYSGKSTFDYEGKITNLYSFDITYGGKEYKDNCLTKDLFVFYSTLYVNYGAQNNLSLDAFNSEILKINTEESNIASFNEVDFTLTLIDVEKEKETVEYFLSIYTTAAEFVQNSNVINKIINDNQNILINTLLFFIPVAAVVSFLLMCVLPMCMKNGQTLGKLIFGIGVLDKDGYTLKKPWYILRWISYFVIEYTLSIFTLGGAFLISFTMFQFTKKRRCINDYFSNSVTVNLKESIFFNSREEEEMCKKYMEKNYEERY